MHQILFLENKFILYTLTTTAICVTYLVLLGGVGAWRPCLLVFLLSCTTVLLVVRIPWGPWDKTASSDKGSSRTFSRCNWTPDPLAAPKLDSIGCWGCSLAPPASKRSIEAPLWWSSWLLVERVVPVCWILEADEFNGKSSWDCCKCCFEDDDEPERCFLFGSWGVGAPRFNCFSTSGIW